MVSITKTQRTNNFSIGYLFRCFITFSSLMCLARSWSTRPSFGSLRRKVALIGSSNVHFPPELAENSTFVHNYFMDLAIDEAKEAARKGEVPIGALVVERNDNKEGSYRILSRGYNMVETTHDASAHAELNALRRASKKGRNWRLFNKTLYSTMEPCPVCLSSAQAFRIHTIVYGAPQVRLGAIESYMRMLDDHVHPFHTIEEVIPGVLKEECAELLKSFFRKKRIEKPRVPMSEYITVKKPFLSRLRQKKKE